jgi:prepilin-type N-terminal cleavage/methylation domain-containing protein
LDLFEIMNMKKLKKGQRGFTLIELLIVIAITGLITAGLTTTIMQVLTMSHRTANRMTAVRQVQQAGFWVSPDVMMAQNVTPGGCTNCLLTLTWKEEGGTGDSHNVTYKLIDMSGGLKMLQREHYLNNSPNPDSTITVAEYIDLAETSFIEDPEGGALNFTVTATVGEQSETRIYEVKRRPE